MNKRKRKGGLAFRQRSTFRGKKEGGELVVRAPGQGREGARGCIGLEKQPRGVRRRGRPGQGPQVGAVEQPSHRCTLPATGEQRVPQLTATLAMTCF